MQIQQNILSITTKPKSLINITGQVNDICSGGAIENGICQLFVCHTSCSLIISENCDPDVLADLETFMSKLVPESGAYRHCAEGSDDMPAHIRSALTQTQISIPVHNKRLGLGRWQAVYLWEHRAFAHERNITITSLGN